MYLVFRYAGPSWIRNLQTLATCCVHYQTSYYASCRDTPDSRLELPLQRLDSFDRCSFASFESTVTVEETHTPFLRPASSRSRPRLELPIVSLYHRFLV